MADTYFSVTEALKAAAWETGHRLEIVPIDSEQIETQGVKLLRGLSAICVPGGFGKRGTEGVITAIQFARQKRLPLLGICLGMQLASIEYARHELGLTDAQSAELSKTGSLVINLMPDQTQKLLENRLGGSMRLGNYRCQLQPKTHARRLYKTTTIDERHRHRYEFNNDFRALFEADPNFVIAGVHAKTNLVEIIELKNHPYFVACQFHSELKSRPHRAHPLFRGLIQAAIAQQKRSVQTLSATILPVKASASTKR